MHRRDCVRRSIFSNQSGFTLIELMGTVSVLAILAAMAIPQYAEYKQGGYDVQARSALHNIGLAEEAYFIEYSVYKNCDQDTCFTLYPEIGKINEGIILEINATTNSFTGNASHVKGTGQVYTWPE